VIDDRADVLLRGRPLIGGRRRAECSDVLFDRAELEWFGPVARVDGWAAVMNVADLVHVVLLRRPRVRDLVIIVVVDRHGRLDWTTIGLLDVRQRIVGLRRR